MENTLSIIPLDKLSIAFIPVLIVLAILFKWSLNGKFALYALSRMLIQLLLVGYFLSYIFDNSNVGIVIVC